MFCSLSSRLYLKFAGFCTGSFSLPGSNSGYNDDVALGDGVSLVSGLSQFLGLALFSLTSAVWRILAMHSVESPSVFPEASWCFGRNSAQVKCLSRHVTSAWLPVGDVNLDTCFRWCLLGFPRPDSILWKQATKSTLPQSQEGRQRQRRLEILLWGRLNSSHLLIPTFICISGHPACLSWILVIILSYVIYFFAWIGPAFGCWVCIDVTLSFCIWSTCLNSGTIRRSMLILCFPCPDPRIGHFSKQS